MAATNKNQLTTLSKFIASYVTELKAKAPKNTGALSNSLKGDYKQTTDGFEIGIDANDYAKYIDAGVNGTQNDRGSIFSFGNKMVPISSVQNYADSIGVSPFAIAKSIQRKGIKPTLFATNTIDDELNKFGDDYAKAVWDDFYEDNKEPEQKNKLKK